MSKGTNNPPVVLTDPSAPTRAIPSYDLAGATPSKTGRTVAGIDEMDLPAEAPERRAQREEEELEKEEDYEVELPDPDDDPDDELDDDIGDEEVGDDDLSDETFDKALEAGIPYSELKDKNEEEVTKMLRQKYLESPDETASKPDTKKGESETPPESPVAGSLEEMLAKLDFDPEEWGETTVEAMKPVKEVVSALAEQVKGLQNERDEMIRAQVSTKFTNDMDSLFNRLDSKEFGKGNFTEVDHGLTARQIRVRKVVASAAAKLIAKEVPMEDAFELAVKKITGDEVSVRGKPKTPKSKRKDRIQAGTSRGKTPKHDPDDEGNWEAAAEHINEFCNTLGIDPL